MTTPAERTRNVIQARRFLEGVSHDGRIPQDVRQEARRLLRHYPLDSEVLMAGEIEEVGAQDRLCGPIFASSLEGPAVVALSPAHDAQG